MVITRDIGELLIQVEDAKSSLTKDGDVYEEHKKISASLRCELCETELCKRIQSILTDMRNNVEIQQLIIDREYKPLNKKHHGEFYSDDECANELVEYIKYYNKLQEKYNESIREANKLINVI